MGNQPTLAEIAAWPATVDVTLACSALGISRAHGYKLVAAGEFPVRVITAGTRRRVVTADLLRTLGGSPALEAA